MADIFTSKRGMPARRKREEARRRLYNNPVLGQSNSEKMRVTRALRAIKERLGYWLMETEGYDAPWYVWEGCVHEKAEDYYYSLREFIERSPVDDDLRLVDMDNPAIKSSNLLEVASWYKNKSGRAFFLVKAIHSPLPCDEWGRLPLTRSQWDIVRTELLASYARWMWVHGVRAYLDDLSFDFGGIQGWHFIRSQKMKSTRSGALCTGRVIYSHVVEKFCALPNGHEPE